MKKHILLIDDDQDELTLFVEALNKVNIPYKCTWAKDGEQALQQLTYLTPDIIFLDINLPGMSGFECLAAIKQRARLQVCPVILHSTNMTADCRDKGIKLGAAACLAKSDTPSELAGILEELIPDDLMTLL
ncbi:response regulator [Flavitalea sp. BT771]|uniref:response regulator n=1 Tax=Flavitalea sp. BT771 TaxID=3063329 RepID=UPI0026E1EA45|nr:response regulator [Flavitalea sp. BT771]MDO6430563.1 response regulator [Flavitalea sp. BT771]MDV6219297.1 response regulator [Flavitalea sp. BT771]